MAKTLLLVLLIPLVATGCALKSHSSAGRSAFDYSEYETYDQPHGAAPSYAALH